MHSCREAGQEGFWAWDCVLKELVLVFIVVLALLGDNPMQSEFCSHVGLRGKFFCQICLVKGKDALAAESQGNREHDESGYQSPASSAGEESDTEAQRPKKGKPVEPPQQMMTRISAFMKVSRFYSCCSVQR
jgi:hypothetical protein